MPESFLFTITFDNLKSYKTKSSLINTLYEFFCRYIIVNSELFYTVEYHKKSDGKTDNYFRPHVHGILYSPSRIPRYQVRNLMDSLKSTYGRILQFALQEDIDEVEGWRLYCMKDVERNEQYTMLPHKFSYVIPGKDVERSNELYIDEVIPDEL